WGTYITTPQVTTSLALVNIRTRIQNESEKSSRVTLTTQLIDNGGREGAKVESTETVESKSTLEFKQEATVQSPMLWSTDSPILYKAVSNVSRDGRMLDALETRFGIRTISFNVEKGFMLNGQTMKLKGGCLHHDNGPLGARQYDRAEDARVDL